MSWPTATRRRASPCAYNLQLVLFKSKQNPDILVQVLLNGFEATLPLEMAAPGCFYRWDDFVQRYSTIPQ